MRVLLAITIFTLLIACKKTKPEFDGVNCSGNCYILSGRVVDTPSNAGLQGVELKFYYFSPGYSPFLSRSRYLGRTMTNSNGKYRFQFDGSNYKTNAGYYLMEATKKGYIYGPLNQKDVRVFDLDSTFFNIPFNQDFALFRPANLSVRVKATTVTNFEFLTIGYHYGNTGSGIILNGNRAIDTTIHFQTAGDVRTFVQWNAAGNGVNIRKSDTLFTNSGGTIQYQVNL